MGQVVLGFVEAVAEELLERVSLRFRNFRVLETKLDPKNRWRYKIYTNTKSKQISIRRSSTWNNSLVFDLLLAKILLCLTFIPKYLFALKDKSRLFIKILVFLTASVQLLGQETHYEWSNTYFSTFTLTERLLHNDQNKLRSLTKFSIPILTCPTYLRWNAEFFDRTGFKSIAEALVVNVIKQTLTKPNLVVPRPELCAHLVEVVGFGGRVEQLDLRLRGVADRSLEFFFWNSA